MSAPRECIDLISSDDEAMPPVDSDDGEVQELSAAEVAVLKSGKARATGDGATDQPPANAPSPSALARRLGKRKMTDEDLENEEAKAAEAAEAAEVAEVAAAAAAAEVAAASDDMDTAAMAEGAADANAAANGAGSDGESDICEEVDAPTGGGVPMAADEDDAQEGEDDDVQFAGRSGALALSDFPHARENCMTKKFGPGKESLFCTNCFCYVCDVAASKCTEWSVHCKATHSSAHWRDERSRKKSAGAAAQPPAAAASGSSSSSASHYAYTPYIERWSCDKMLAGTEQVYPVETSEAQCPGLKAGVSLRPYQKQSLAFMIHIERHGYAGHDNSNATNAPRDTASSAAAAGGSASSSSSGGDVKPGKAGADAGGAAATAATAPSGHRANEFASSSLRSGWLADEMVLTALMVERCLLRTPPLPLPALARSFSLRPVPFTPPIRQGMGKTAVCAALVLANPSTDCPVVNDTRFARLKGEFDNSVHPIPLKLTLIIVNNTLVQQWADELKKFAPGLKVSTRLGVQTLHESHALVLAPGSLRLAPCSLLATTRCSG